MNTTFFLSKIIFIQTWNKTKKLEKKLKASLNRPNKRKENKKNLK